MMYFKLLVHVLFTHGYWEILNKINTLYPLDVFTLKPGLKDHYRVERSLIGRKAFYLFYVEALTLI